MITIAATGATLRTGRYLHHKDTVLSTTSMVTETGDCCWCSCDSEIPAFADLNNETTKANNDIFSWILKVPTNCTVVATLTNLDTGTDYIITDNTYGFLYDVGDLKANVWGFMIRWYLVADSIGFGNYQMNISVSNATPTLIFTKDYPKFKLMPYSCANAHGTVRVESFNSGYIEGGFDYRNMIILNPYPTGVSIKGIEGWIQQIRYYGKLSISAIPVETDNIFDGYRNLKQVQTQIKNEYNLRIDFIKTDLSEQIIYDNLLADYILLNDYNANNVKDYREVKVSLLSVDPPESFKNRTNLFNIKFVDYLQNLLKRHY